MIFKTDSIELFYGHKKVLNSVYLKAETGKITGVLGRNGSGKSSLFHVIFGHLKAKYSHIKLNNNIYLKPLYTSKNVNYLHQKKLTPNYITVKNAFSLYGVDLNLFLEKFPELSVLSHVKMKRLSGGERRVIEIYLVIMKVADLVILDEPFNQLSPIYIEKIEVLLQEQKNKKAIIISDHIFRPILRLSDTVYFLENGNMKEIKNKKELEDLHYFV
jgi:ABC-type multidrug transport system ATPase subunit